MAIRRKTKTERELVADIRKAHTKFCNKHSTCKGCPLEHAKDCTMEYIKMLFELEFEEESGEDGPAL